MRKNTRPNEMLFCTRTRGTETTCKWLFWLGKDFNHILVNLTKAARKCTRLITILRILDSCGWFMTWEHYVHVIKVNNLTSRQKIGQMIEWHQSDLVNLSHMSVGPIKFGNDWKPSSIIKLCTFQQNFNCIF